MRAAIAETFAVHAARSVQHTLYAIADVVLATYEEILDITLSMHERPYRPADLFSAQLENPDELFVPPRSHSSWKSPWSATPRHVLRRLPSDSSLPKPQRSNA